MAAEATPQSIAAGASARPAGIPPRSVVLGLLMSLITIVIVVWAEYAEGSIQVGHLQIPPAAVALLFVVVLVNRLAACLWPTARLRPSELITVYVMMVFTSMVPSRGVSER